MLTGAALARKNDSPRRENECGDGKLRDPKRNDNCKLQRLVNKNQWEERWPKVSSGPAGLPEDISTDHTSPSIWRDLAKCIQCGLCADVCGEAVQQQHVIGFANRGFDRRPVTVFDTPLGETNCISCGHVPS